MLSDNILSFLICGNWDSIRTLQKYLPITTILSGRNGYIPSKYLCGLFGFSD